jgi:phosphoribosylformylglycinamidine synthase
MTAPKIIILAGYGLNCEEETARGFSLAGGLAEIVHINDLVNNTRKLKNYEIMAVPGGFSYGDDTGSGKAYANKLKNHLRDELKEFVLKDKLVIGICNGFQILTQIGLVPGALAVNKNARYLDRWVDLKVVGQSPWLKGIKKLSLPIAHGEGKYFIDQARLKTLKKDKGIAVQYAKGEICQYQDLEANPNGAMLDIAGVTSNQGRVFGLMPHPERAMFFHHLPHWPVLKEKAIRQNRKILEYGPGMQIFKNSIEYFS